MKLAKAILILVLGAATAFAAKPGRRVVAPTTDLAELQAVPPPIRIAPSSVVARVISWGEITAHRPFESVVPYEVSSPKQLQPPTPVEVENAIVGPPTVEPTPSVTAGSVEGTLARMGIRFPAMNSTINPIHPPDTMGAIGPRHFVEVLNGSFAVYDRDTGQRLDRVSLPAFFSIVPGFKFDPRVIFDAPSGRWIASAARSPGNTPTPFGICLAVSQTDDPLGDWFQVFFSDPVLPDTLHDFPMLGVGPKGIYIGALVSNEESSKNLWAFDKAAMTASPPSVGTITLWRFAIFQPLPVPVQSLGPLGADIVTTVAPLTGAFTVYFVEGTPSQPVLRTQGTTFLSPIESIPIGAPAPGVYKEEALSAGPYLGTVPIYRNRNLWLALRLQVSFRNAVNWTRINPFTSPPRVLESTTITHPTLHLTFPSLAVNGVTNTLMAFSASDDQTFVGAYYTGRVSSDPPGTYAPITLLKAGEAPFGTGEFTSRRWGDYSNTMVDPRDDLTFWTIQEYAGFRGQPNTWGTWVASFRYDRFDCNNNQREDACDIDCDAGGCSQPCGFSEDCQENGVPDECEPQTDCNANGAIDACEVHLGDVLDCNQNGRPDECDPGADCNDNSIPDECELDCNGNSIPDDCDMHDGGLDCNENGILDACERRPNFLVQSEPASGRALGRLTGNSICLTFQCDVSDTVELGRDITVAELVPGGTFSSDFSSGFELVHRDDRTICLIDRVGRLEDGHWYTIANAGWEGVQGFSPIFPVRHGDVDGNGWVLSSDFARINAVLPGTPADPYDPRDLNGDRVIDAADAAFVLLRIPTRIPPKPAGHGG